MHTTIPGSLVPADSSNFGPPDGSAPDLDRLGARSSTLEVKVNEILLRFATPAARTERFQIRPVTFRRLPTLWAYLRPRSQGLSKISAYIYIYISPYHRFGRWKWLRLRCLWLPSWSLALARSRRWFHSYQVPPPRFSGRQQVHVTKTRNERRR